jgi:hypothetical protein
LSATDLARPARRGKPLNSRELVDDICDASPALREARRSHIESFGTLIPHVFMAQVLARMCACLQNAPDDSSGRRAELEGVLAALETGMGTGDRETRNVISISFVSDGELEPYFGRLRLLMGPKLLAQIQGK